MELAGAPGAGVGAVLLRREVSGAARLLVRSLRVLSGDAREAARRATRCRWGPAGAGPGAGRGVSFSVAGAGGPGHRAPCHRVVQPRLRALRADPGSGSVGVA